MILKCLKNMLTPEQTKALTDYEKLTGFGPMYQESLSVGEITFKELWEKNVQWFRDWTDETTHALESSEYTEVS